jgi:hypothetical protein
MPYAIGEVGPAGNLLQAAELVQQRIAERGPHMVLVAPTGSVYLVLAWENRAELLAEQFPNWVAGVFTSAASFEDLAVDMAETYALLQQLEAA